MGSPGTTYILDDDTASSDPATTNPNLKYDRSGPVPIILVPQPSDDPNDPLVRTRSPAVPTRWRIITGNISCSVDVKASTDSYTFLELASLASRPHSCCPLLCLCDMRNHQSSLGSEHGSNLTLFRKRLYKNRPAYRISSLWRRSCWDSLRTHGTGLGQTTSVYTRGGVRHVQLSLGWLMPVHLQRQG